MLPATSSIHIRRATSADAARLAELASRTFEEKWTPHNTAADMAAYLAEHFGADQQLRELRDPATTYLLAESESETVGYARLRRGPVPACVSDPTALEMVRLYVLASWHGRRVGATLMAECLEEARRLGAQTLWLGVWPENHQAVRFYQAWGFREVGRKLFKLGEDVSEDLVMARAV